MNNYTVQLHSGKHDLLKPNHPWIYKYQINERRSSAPAAQIVSVIDSKGKFIGQGYYNPNSQISVRILSRDKTLIDKNFFCKKIQESIEKRISLFKRTNALRLVFSESDGLPGLIIDQYNDVVVFQIFTLGMEKLKSHILAAITEVIGAKYIYEKSDSPFRELEGLTEIKMWHGIEKTELVDIFEGKAKFYVDVEKGHKTGFYLDQRGSREALWNFVREVKVLDLFCYSGGFSINAALAGAKSVLAVDVKQEWLDFAKNNAQLNDVSGKIDFVCGDAFDVLKKIVYEGNKFDVAIVDPPSFLRSKKVLDNAIKGYEQLNFYAMSALNNRGVLCTFSCSHNMKNEIFSKIIQDAAKRAKKKISILKRCHQASDHPIVRHIPETEYLKGYFLKVEG